MRSILIIFFIIFALSSSSYGQASVSVEVGTISDSLGQPSLPTEILTQYRIRFTNNTSSYVTGNTTGIVIHDNGSGAQWSPPEVYLTGAIREIWYDGGFFANLSSVDGSGADTIGLGGFAFMGGTGLPPGFDEVVAVIQTSFDNSQQGLTVCIDSAFYQPSSSWVWSLVPGGGVIPSWNGPKCFDLYHTGCLCFHTNITNCMPMGRHKSGETLEYDFDAFSDDGDEYWFTLSGPGTIDSATGVWNWTPTPFDTGHFVINVGINTIHGAGASCSSDLFIDNSPPEFLSGCYENLFVCKPYVNYQIIADPIDFDPLTYSIIDIIPPADSVTIDSATGLIYVPYLIEYFNIVFTVTVGVTDGIHEISCQFSFDLIKCDIYGDMDGDGGHSISDLTKIVDFMFRGGTAPHCLSMADTNGDDNVNVVDITYLVSYLFRGGPLPPEC